MWKSKKFIIVAVIVAVVLVGTVAGVALAQTSSGSTTTPAKTFAARVAAILGVDQQKVEDAFAKAKRDMSDEALTARLDALVKLGKITQQQADQYKSWWQSRPLGVAPGLGEKGPLGGRHLGGRAWPRLQLAPTPTQ